MDISIEPYTQKNCFIKEPNGRYITESCIGHQAYSPRIGFPEEEIPEVVEQLKKLLGFFLGEHAIKISKLIRCKPYVHNFGTRPETRDWKIVFDKKIELKTEKAKSPEITIYKGSSFGDRGWFIKVKFFDDISDFGLGSVWPSYKWALSSLREEWMKEYPNWQYEDTRKRRKVKCNDCEKELLNTEAEQCPKCGRYFCKDCLSDVECLDCQKI